MKIITATFIPGVMGVESSFYLSIPAVFDAAADYTYSTFIYNIFIEGV